MGAKETARHKWVHVATKFFNMAVNYFDAKKPAHCSRVVVVAKLVVSGTQCNCILILLDVKRATGTTVCISFIRFIHFFAYCT